MGIKLWLLLLLMTLGQVMTYTAVKFSVNHCIASKLLVHVMYTTIGSLLKLSLWTHHLFFIIFR
ncbi:hypothetical protein I3760_09G166300 [Carya illinoinensis]|nr:hypothetical protein I3760_09G166300 [Carya illinoinensis]